MVFGGLWVLLSSPTLPLIQGFSFPLEQGFPGNWGTPCPPPPPTQDHTSQHGGNIGSTPKPRGRRRNPPKSEGVPEEMGNAAECPTGCTTQGGPQIPFFSYFQKNPNLGVHPPPKLKHSQHLQFPSFSQRRKGSMLLFPAGPSYLCTGIPDPPGFQAVWGFPVFPKRGRGGFRGITMVGGWGHLKIPEGFLGS